MMPRPRSLHQRILCVSLDNFLELYNYFEYLFIISFKEIIEREVLTTKKVPFAYSILCLFSYFIPTFCMTSIIFVIMRGTFYNSFKKMYYLKSGSQNSCKNNLYFKSFFWPGFSVMSLQKYIVGYPPIKEIIKSIEKNKT